MSHSHEDERFSDDLQHVADVLRDGRPTLDPLALDRVKLRAMSGARRSSSSQPKGFLRQRLAALLTAGLLVLGTGGTLALAGGGGGGGASASFHQYKPPCVHGKGRHVLNECPGEKVEKGGHGGKGGKGGKGHGGKGKGSKGHGGKGKGKGSKGKGSKGGKTRHGNKPKHGRKTGH
jgi:hypothetical protein